VQIEKRISFSLDGVWADWWLSSKHPEAHQRDFSFSRFLISLGSKTGTPFLPEYAKLCQSYFCFYCKIFWKVKRETVEALCGTFGGVRLLASLFCTRRSIESDAMTHRTPKHSVQNHGNASAKVERVVLNALANQARLFRLISCAFGEPSGIVFRRSRSTLLETDSLL
jgi:hypothetical protein